jgi:hypothetical protein
MGIDIFSTLSMAGLIFMLYALVHFVAESRRQGPDRGSQPLGNSVVYLGTIGAEKVVVFRPSSARRQPAMNHFSRDVRHGT